MKNKDLKLVNAYSNLKTHKTISVYKSNKGPSSFNAGIVTKIFGILLSILLIITLFRVLAGIDNGGMTFTTLLQYFSEFEAVHIDWSIPSIDLGSDWGIFNFLLPIFNGIIGILNFGITLCSMLITFLVFMFNIVKWVFLI